MIRLLRPAVPRPDFLQPARGIGALPWAATATGLLVLGLAALDAQGAWQTRQRALDRLARAQAPASTVVARSVGGASAASAGRLPAPPSGDRMPAGDRPAEARRWLQRLARPWPAIWAASEVAGADNIAWQGLDLGETGRLRLDGLARETHQALDAAQALRAQHHDGVPLWRDVVVARIDRQADGQRFEIGAQLAGSATPLAAAATTRPAP